MPHEGGASNGRSLAPVEDVNNARLATTTPGETDSARAIAEVQGAIIVAQRSPRNTVAAIDRVTNSFQRPKLAEKAMYAFPRGGENVTGLSIRAAESIAQNWGNFQFGWRELDRRMGSDGIGTSLLEAFAWDVETNTRTTRTFGVKHQRDTRRGTTVLKDERDIYELNANQASRRVRACILALIPFDVQEVVIEQAETTLRASVNVTKELITGLVATFNGIGVSKEALEKRLRRRIDALTPAQVIDLRKIYAAIKDGMTTPADYFDVEPTIDQPEGASKTAVIAEQLESKAQQVAQSANVGGDGAATETPAATDSTAAKPTFPAEPAWKDLPAARIVEFFDETAMVANISSEDLAKVIVFHGGKVTMTNAPGIYSALKSIAAGEVGVASFAKPTATLDEQVKKAAESAGLTPGKLTILQRAHAPNGLTDANVDAVLGAIAKEAAKP